VSATVHLDRGTILSLESSTQRRSEPSGFLTKRMDEAAGLELGRTNPFSRFSFRFVQSFEFYCRQGIDRSERAQVSFKWNVMIIVCGLVACQSCIS